MDLHEQGEITADEVTQARGQFMAEFANIERNHELWLCGSIVVAMGFSHKS